MSIPSPPKKKHAEKPDWKSLIQRIWGGDPTTCPCCRAQMKNVGTIIRRAEIEFFLRLWGMWEGITSLPPPPDPPFDIEKRRGSNAFWTQAKPEPAGRGRQAGRANQMMEPEALPPGWEIPKEHLPPPEEWWHQNDSESGLLRGPFRSVPSQV